MDSETGVADAPLETVQATHAAPPQEAGSVHPLQVIFSYFVPSQ